MLNINADEWEPTFTCLGAAIPYMYECPGGEDDGGDRLGLLSQYQKPSPTCTSVPAARTTAVTG
jgi:hypothetical protein